MGRRGFLGAAVGTASLALAGSATAYHDRYEEVVDIVEAGADNTGEESITPVVEEVLAEHGDNLAIEFPEGTYLMDEQVYFTEFDRLALYGDDATIVPASADEFEGPSRLFKLGTSDSPGGWLDFRNFTFDFTGDNTGLRAIQTQTEDFWIGDIDVVGRHDTGTWGPIHADVLDSGAVALISNVSIPDGGAYTTETDQDASPTVDTGPTGIIVSPAHQGTLYVQNCEVGAFPDNGLYSSSTAGTVHVEGGTFRNSNVANIRFDGDGSSVTGSTIVVDENRERDKNQRGIRLDEGQDTDIVDVDIEMPSATGEAIRLSGGGGDVTISGVEVTFDNEEGWEDVISVDSDAGAAEIHDTTVRMDGGGQAIQIASYTGGGEAPVELHDVTITGDVSGADGGRHAIRCERALTVLDDVVVDQPGDAYRRAVVVTGPDCLISGGEYTSTHHPLMIAGDHTEIESTTARAYNGAEAIKLRDGTGSDIHDSVLYNGVVNYGADDVDDWDNEYPEA